MRVVVDDRDRLGFIVVDGTGAVGGRVGVVPVLGGGIIDDVARTVGVLGGTVGGIVDVGLDQRVGVVWHRAAVYGVVWGHLWAQTP